LQVEELALLKKDRQPQLAEGALDEGLAFFAPEAYQCDMVTGGRERGADTDHPLIVVEVVGDGADYPFSCHREVKIMGK